MSRLRLIDFGLRAYDGDQAIEWPTVEYAPMPGLPPIRVQGCEPGCVHEWGDQLLQREQSGRHRLKWETGGDPAAKIPHGPVSQGAYCIHCGGWRGGLGLEPDPFAYVGHLILCLREWQRILRDDGLVFCNLGDSYNSGSSGGLGGSTITGGQRNQAHSNRNGRGYVTGLKPKSLMQIPQRFALAAQADGWFVRNDIIWSKPNPMPESVTDRFTRSHEYIYMLAKSERYFFDSEAVKEPITQSSIDRSKYGWNGRTDDQSNGARTGSSFKRMADSGEPIATIPQSGYRNKRSVWTIATRPFGAAHFACFPPEIPEICIRAGTSARGCCPACGAPWRRVVERTAYQPEIVPNGHRNVDESRGDKTRKLSGKEYNEQAQSVTTGWEPTCSCPDAGASAVDCTTCQGTGCDLEWFASAPPMTNEEHLAEAPKHICPDCGGFGERQPAEPVPCVVLDPFSGSGTTGKVAVRLGRRYIGVDLSEKYLTEITDARMGAGVQMELSW